MESLLSKSASEAAGVDTSLVKVIVVGAIGVLLAGATGYFLKTVIDGESNLIPLVLFAAGFFAVFLLQIFFIKSRGILNAAALAESAAVGLWFIGEISWAFLLAWALLALFWVLVARRGQKELDNQISIKFLRVEKAVMPRAFTVFALFIAIVVVWVNGAALTKERFQKLIQPTQPVLQRVLSQNFSFNMTIAKFAELTLERNLGDTVAALPAAAKSLAINQALNQLRDQFGLNFKNSDTFSDVIYNYMMSWLEKIPKPIRVAFPISAMLLIFLTVKGFSFLLRWVVALAAYAGYEIALMTGFAAKALESRSREIVTLK